MDFLTLASKRYSVRKFVDKPVDKDAVEQILCAAKVAPTAHNNQPQSIITVSSQQGLAALRKCTECHYNAPLAFIVCYDKRLAWVRSYDGKHSGDVDASIVATHMMLQAEQLGIGCTWIMYFIPEAVKVEFELDEHIEPVAILVMGYPDCQPAPAHFCRKELSQTVTYR